MPQENQFPTTQEQLQRALLRLDNLATVVAENARAAQLACVGIERLAVAMERLVASHQALVTALLPDSDDGIEDEDRPAHDLDGNPMPRERDQTQSLDRPRPPAVPTSGLG